MRKVITAALCVCIIASHPTAALGDTRKNARTLQADNGTFVPTDSPVPSPSPSATPSNWPTISQLPTVIPTVSQVPTTTPTWLPTMVRSIPPTDSPVPSPSPSIVPSMAPTTDAVLMWGLLSTTLVGLDGIMNEEMMFLFSFLVKESIRENLPPDSEVTVEPVTVDITNQVVSGENLTVTYNVTSIVAPRPLPPDFNYTELISYAVNFNLTEFLAELIFLRDEQKQDEEGTGAEAGGGSVSSVEETQREVGDTKRVLSPAAIVGIILAILLIILLLLCLCSKLFRKTAVSEDEVEEEDLAILENQSTWDKMAAPTPSEESDIKGGVYAVPNANVHKCKSAFCPTCTADAGEDGADFVSVSPSWGGLVYAFSFGKATSMRASTRQKTGHRQS